MLLGDNQMHRSGNMTIADRLSNHMDTLSNGDVSLSTTQRLMDLLREFLEEKGIRTRYPLLGMYCDWSLHSRLNRSLAGTSLLDLLDQVWANSHVVDEQIQSLVRQLSPQMLRDQMLEVLRNALIWPAAIQNDECFRRIVHWLVADLAGKPISRRPKDEPKRISERLALGYRFVAHRIAFENTSENMQLVLCAKQIEPTSGGEVRIQIPWPT